MTEQELIELMGSAGVFSEDELAHERGMLCHARARCSGALAHSAARGDEAVAYASRSEVLQGGGQAVAGASASDGPSPAMARASCNELLLNLLTIKAPWGSLYRDTLCALLRQSSVPAPGSKQTWKQAWAINRDQVMHGIEDLCRQDPSCMDALLEALRAVADVSEAIHICDDAAFKVDFALAAHNAGVLSFSTWVSEAVSREGGEDVALECMKLATKRYQGEADARCDRFKTDTLLQISTKLEHLQADSGACRVARDKLRSASRGRLLGGVIQAPGPTAQGTAVPVGAGAPGAGAAGAHVAMGVAPGAVVGEPGQQGQQQQSALFAPEIEEAHILKCNPFISST